MAVNSGETGSFNIIIVDSRKFTMISEKAGHLTSSSAGGIITADSEKMGSAEIFIMAS